MLIASKSRFAIDKLKKNLSSEFEVKDLGEMKVLGMKIEPDLKGGKVSLTQKWYMKNVPPKFNINLKYEVCKYTIGRPSFQVKSYHVSYYY